MVDRLDKPGTSWGALVPLFGALLVVAGGAYLTTSALIPTLGLIVVGASLFLAPVQTAMVAGTAAILAVVLALASGAEDGQVRLLNVLLACGLAVLASFVLARRMRRIEQQAKTAAALLASVPDALFVLDAEGCLRLANSGLTNLVPAGRIGQQLHPLLGHVRADGSPCPGGCVLDGGTPDHADVVPVEGERITRAGVLIPVAYTTQPLQPGVAVSLRDVSNRVRKQSERRASLEAAARREEQTRLLLALESPVRPPPPQVPGVVSDVWEAAGEPGTPSRDAVDLSTLADGRMLALVVDPTEEGTLSAPDSWKVMYAARAHMASGALLADMVGRCAQMLANDGGVPTVTLLGVVIDPETGLVEVASGGHLPPLLVRADGRSTWLEAAGQALGSARPGSQSIAIAELQPGDVLVLYTDQLIAGGDLVEGLSSLRAAAVALRGQPSAGWAQRVATAVHAGSPEPAAVAALRLPESVPVRAG